MLVKILHISMITDRKAWVGFSLDGMVHDKSHHVAYVVVWMGFSNWTLGGVVSGEFRVVGGLFKMPFVCWLACWGWVAESSDGVEVDVEEFDAFGLVWFGGGSFFESIRELRRRFSGVTGLEVGGGVLFLEFMVV